MKRALLVLLLASPALAQRPSTIANGDSCDISLVPAATLLLPYFEVDFTAPQSIARTTLFTIQNTTALPQIARVTLWTDWAYPVLTFNVFLTGYDVQSINLYDLFANGAVASGASSATTPGDRSMPNNQNPHFLPDAVATCAATRGRLSASLLADLRAVFTTGKLTSPSCTLAQPVGGFHTPAAGYATIDVVANCNATSPLDAAYFNHEILFDNVLTGDVQHLNPNPATGNYAGGNPLVHIRAVPPGGAAGEVVPTSLPYTFYDLYTTGAPSRTYDRRQPLPSAFAPHFIQGGTGAFNTELMIWREPLAPPGACPNFVYRNSVMITAELVRFDEHENPTTTVVHQCADPPDCDPRPFFPPASKVSAGNTSKLGESSTSGDVAGWIYLNLDNGNGARRSQSWIVTSMFAEGRFSVEMDAAALGNGCSPSPQLSTRAPIGPAP